MGSFQGKGANGAFFGLNSREIVEFCGNLMSLQGKERCCLPGAHASLRAGRGAFKSLNGIRVDFKQTLLRREARRSTHGCVRSRRWRF